MTVQQGRVAFKNPSTLRIIVCGGILSWIGTSLEDKNKNLDNKNEVPLQNYGNKELHGSSDDLWHGSLHTNKVGRSNKNNNKTNFNLRKIVNTTNNEDWLYSLSKDIFMEPNTTLMEAINKDSIDSSISSNYDNESTAAREEMSSTSTISDCQPPKQEEEEATNTSKDKKAMSTKIYDFVIIGNGNTGQSAVKELKLICPSATIAVIDPLRVHHQQSNKSSDDSNHRHRRRRKYNKKNDSMNIHYFSETVARFHPSTRSVQLVEDPNAKIKYKYGILVATGARGAPPPLEIFEEQALTQVLELRTTELKSNSKYRPVVSPETIRETVLQSIMSWPGGGAKIGILGSGWDALDLVYAITQKQQQLQQLYPKKSYLYEQQRPTIVFGNPGPVWNRLPQYLSAEVRKKLRKKGIDVQDRSVVRYIAHIPSFTRKNVNTGKTTKTRSKVELHTAKSYDILETKRSVLDYIVVAPDTTGTKGTAAIPTLETPNRMMETSDGRPWYKTWSQLTTGDKPSSLSGEVRDPSVVVCFEDDGRIAVNTELSAASGVYAAGSVAKYPNSSTGNASIAGEGPMDGTVAGRIAAINMSREYLLLNSSSSSPLFSQQSLSGEGIHDNVQSFAASSLPIWRSDVTSYKSKTQTQVQSSLVKFGIQALCVGNCDSERFYTRGFWWTNASAQRRLNRLLEGEEEDYSNEEGLSRRRQQTHQSTTNSPETIAQRRLTRRRQTARVRRKLGLVAPIYGIGVVYYLDNVGRIQGIMTWGLPFVSKYGENNNELNPHLINRLNHIIRTNGGISAVDSQENHGLVNTFLAKESQQIVSLAVRGYAQSFENGKTNITPHGLGGPISGFSKPLYRYTEPPKSTSLNSNIKILKRKDRTNLGVLGEDLYARDELTFEDDDNSLEEESTVTNSDQEGDEEIIEEESMNLPTALYPVTIYPMRNAATTSMSSSSSGKVASAESLAEMNRYLAVQRGWEDNENRARPGKEDPLWLRPGDERKNISSKQLLVERFRSILFPHQS